ncbi:hypothetical protein SEEM031_12275 [Salmonella enterica subsp. enterica serovar Montevideo str. SARB31]|nr:hypothetical protein SEEM031_12275 [Salmonella enterica subsp. enterica serovar Montevideo str. SARB31]
MLWLSKKTLKTTEEKSDRDRILANKQKTVIYR